MRPEDEALIAWGHRQRELAEDLVVKLLDAHGGDPLAALCEAARKVVGAEHVVQVLAAQRMDIVDELPGMLERSQDDALTHARRSQARLGADGLHKESRQARADVFAFFDAHHQPGMTMAALAEACVAARLVPLKTSTIQDYASKWKAERPERFEK